MAQKRIVKSGNQRIEIQHQGRIGDWQQIHIGWFYQSHNCCWSYFFLTNVGQQGYYFLGYSKESTTNQFRVIHASYLIHYSYYYLIFKRQIYTFLLLQRRFLFLKLVWKFIKCFKWQKWRVQIPPYKLTRQYLTILLDLIQWYIIDTINTQISLFTYDNMNDCCNFLSVVAEIKQYLLLCTSVWPNHRNKRLWV